MNPQSPEDLLIGGLAASRRKAALVSVGGLVAMGPSTHQSGLPWVVTPAVSGVDLVEWARAQTSQIEELLLAHGAILFRGFHIEDPQRLHEFAAATSSGGFLEYRDRSSPRSEIANRIYTSTEYPADRPIFLHNEGTYWLRWPLKILFCCVTPPASGGETPIADTRKILARLRRDTVDAFANKDVMYVRNFNQGFGLPWTTVFQTSDPALVEEFARHNRIDVEWLPGGRLRTRQVRKAIAVHPRTGQQVWFNHAAFFHVTTLESDIRAEVMREFKEEDLPYNTYFGDGSPIPAAMLEEIRAAYESEKIAFRWEQGSVLLLDNMALAHGRNSFSGDRKVLVAMVEPHAPEEHLNDPVRGPARLPAFPAAGASVGLRRRG